MDLLVRKYFNEVFLFRRVRLFLKCLLPDKVPDPANSKWVKECVLQTVPT